MPLMSGSLNLATTSATIAAWRRSRDWWKRWIRSAGSRETMYSGSGLSVSAIETEMGTCSLSYDRLWVGRSALLVSWYDSKS